MMQIYKESVIKSRQNRFEGRLNKLFLEVLEVTGWDDRFNDIDARDDAQEADLHQRCMTLGAYSVNDILGRLGLESVEGCDEKIIWLNPAVPRRVGADGKAGRGDGRSLYRRPAVP